MLVIVTGTILLMEWKMDERVDECIEDERLDEA